MKASYLDGRKIIVNDQVYLYLYGTSYLGLPYSPDFQSLFQEGILKYGSSLGSSPNSIPQLSVYEELEHLLANRYGFEEALLFPSGYAAGQTVVNLYHQQGHIVAYGNVAHPALKSESKIIRPENREKTGKASLLAMDFLDPITFEKYDLNNTVSQKDKVLIDASHGLGIFDDEIKALSTAKYIILCGSLNKAMGINAGVLLCSKGLKKELQSSLRYKTASAPSPAECYALKRSIDTGLVSDKQQKLGKLIDGFGANELFRNIKGFPVLSLKSNSPEISDYFKQQEVLIWRNNYPTEASPIVNRAVFTAAHTQEDVAVFLALLDKLR